MTLMGFEDSESAGTVPSVLTVDIKSGEVQAIPEGKDETFEGITASGGYLLWRARDSELNDQTVVKDAPTQKVVDQHGGRVLAVAHAKNVNATVALAETGPRGILLYKPDADKMKRLEIESLLPKYASHLLRATSLRVLRSILPGGTNYPEPGSGRRLYLETGEVIMYAQSLPLPKPELPLPQLNSSASDEDEQAWQEYKTACETYAQTQGDKSDLALLQCLVAPW